MISKKTFLLAVILLFSAGCFAWAHAPGNNPSRPDDSPSGKNPGSAISQGEWQGRAEKELENIEALIEANQKIFAKVGEGYKKDWDKSVEMTKRIEDLGRDNDQKIAELEGLMTKFDHLMELSKNNVSQEVWDSACDKYSNEIGGRTATTYTVFDMFKPLKNDPAVQKLMYDLFAQDLKEEKIIKEELGKAYAARTEAQTGVEEKGAALDELRAKLEQYQAAKEYNQGLIEVIKTDPAAAQRYESERKNAALS